MICEIEYLSAASADRRLFEVHNIRLVDRVHILYGPSGIGKSIFLSALCHRTNSALSAGVTVTGQVNFCAAIKHVAHVAQHPPRLDLTVRQFFDFAAHCYKPIAADLAVRTELIDIFELAPLFSQNMRELSGGQLQRVHLVSAISSQANLLLLDEPTAALDDVNTQRFADIIARITAPVIIATHDTRLKAFAADLADWPLINFPFFQTGTSAAPSPLVSRLPEEAQP